ncbi:hypothetical protein NX059_003807 [Plenodomus lindquistii]|nr:hypothetical protein NX059_003807 [Plenodomus lindquistii]
MAEPTQDPALQPQTAETEAPQTNGHAPQSTDIEMADSIAQPELPTTTSTTTIAPQPSSAPDQQQPPPALQPQPSAPSPAPTPAPASLPAPASSRNSPHPIAQPQAPTQPIPHGSPTRVYLNQNVTPYLLEAMKHLATTEPDKPLKWLSEFLAKKSAEIEGP